MFIQIATLTAVLDADALCECVWILFAPFGRPWFVCFIFDLIFDFFLFVHSFAAVDVLPLNLAAWICACSAFFAVVGSLWKSPDFNGFSGCFYLSSPFNLKISFFVAFSFHFSPLFPSCKTMCRRVLWLRFLFIFQSN
jgi:hypothetical protein